MVPLHRLLGANLYFSVQSLPEPHACLILESRIRLILPPCDTCHFKNFAKTRATKMVKLLKSMSCSHRRPKFGSKYPHGIHSCVHTLINKKQYWSDFNIHHTKDLKMTHKHMERYSPTCMMGKCWWKQWNTIRCLIQWPKWRTQITPNSGKDVKQEELSFFSGRKTKCYSHFRRVQQFYLKN